MRLSAPHRYIALLFLLKLAKALPVGGRVLDITSIQETSSISKEGGETVNNYGEGSLADAIRRVEDSLKQSSETGPIASFQQNVEKPRPRPKAGTPGARRYGSVDMPKTSPPAPKSQAKDDIKSTILIAPQPTIVAPMASDKAEANVPAAEIEYETQSSIFILKPEEKPATPVYEEVAVIDLPFLASSPDVEVQVETIPKTSTPSIVKTSAGQKPDTLSVAKVVVLHRPASASLLRTPFDVQPKSAPHKVHSLKPKYWRWAVETNVETGAQNLQASKPISWSWSMKTKFVPGIKSVHVSKQKPSTVIIKEKTVNMVPEETVEEFVPSITFPSMGPVSLQKVLALKQQYEGAQKTFRSSGRPSIKKVPEQLTTSQATSYAITTEEVQAPADLQSQEEPQLASQGEQLELITASGLVEVDPLTEEISTLAREVLSLVKDQFDAPEVEQKEHSITFIETRPSRAGKFSGELFPPASKPSSMAMSDFATSDGKGKGSWIPVTIPVSKPPPLHWLFNHGLDSKATPNPQRFVPSKKGRRQSARLKEQHREIT